QTGATNRVTPAVTKAAAAEIQEGKVIVMSYPLADGIPLFGTRFTKTILTATTLAPGAALGENQPTYMQDTWLSQSHVGTHLEGDILIIHTGWGNLFEQYPAQNAVYNSGEPGLGKEAANWLVSQKIVAVGNDTWGVEVIPGENPKEAFIVHNILLTDAGIH